MAKNIVVIGASFSGHGVVNNLLKSIPDDYRILLVERSEFVVHVPAMVRACVVPGWEDKGVMARITQDNIFPAASRHRVIAPNGVVELRKTSVVLEKEFEGSTEVPFEKCVIATGALQDEPMRPRPGATEAEFKAALREIQAGIKAATKILVIGGGAVGVEVAGEIGTAYPDKQLVLVHADNGLLHPTAASAPASKPAYVSPPTETKVGNSLATQLRARGVDVRLGERALLDGGLKTGPLGGVQKITLASGKTVEADYVFVSIGNRPNSGLVAAADPGALTANAGGAGYIVVDEYFRVRPGSPASPLAGQYYALGDVASVNSWKTCVAAMFESAALAASIAAELKGRAPRAYTPAANAPIIVTLGTTGGAGSIPVPLLGSIGAPGFVIGMKNKDLFVARSFAGRFKGSETIGA